MPLNLTDIEGLPADGSTQTIGTISDVVLISKSDDWYDGAIIITCTVKCNGVPYIEEYYSLPPFGNIKLDMRELLKHVFEYAPPMLEITEPQLSSNIKEIDVTFSTGSLKETTSFLLINNRLEGLDTEFFYESSFLTLQPRHKDIYMSDREVLTCYAENSDFIIMCRASNIAQSQTIEHVSLLGGMANLVLDFNILAKKFAIKNITSFYLFMDGYDNEALYGQTYNILPGKAPEVPMFYFENSVGGFDLIRPTGEVKDKNKYKTQLVQRDRKTIGYHIDNTDTINVNSGYLSTPQERAFFRDFLESKNIYILEKGELLSIVITEATAEAIHYELGSFSFDYKKSITRSISSMRHDAFHAPHNEVNPFRLSKEFTLYDKSGGMKFFFLRGIFPKDFANPERYSVAISTRLQNRMKTGIRKQFNDRIEYTNITLNNADKPTIGFLTATDNVTGEQAVALIYIG